MSISISELSGVEALEALDGAREDLIRTVNNIPVIGKQIGPQFVKVVDDLEDLVEERAAVGATSAVEKLLKNGLYVSIGLTVATIILTRIMIKRQLKKAGVAGLGFAEDKHDRMASSALNTAKSDLRLAKNSGSCRAKRVSLTEASKNIRMANQHNDAGLNDQVLKGDIRDASRSILDEWSKFDDRCLRDSGSRGRRR